MLAHGPNKTCRERTEADRREGIASFHHFAFEYRDREAWLAQLERVRGPGIEVVRGPVVHSPWHPRGECSWGENESIYVLDPDGHRLEMFCDMATITDDGGYVDVYGSRIEGPVAVEA